MEIINNSPKYDVIVVGSGAGGGMATKILSDAGLKIALVEAGPYFDPANPDQMTQMKWPWESPRRGSGTTRAFGDFHMSYGHWKIEGEPYTIEKETNFKEFYFSYNDLCKAKKQSDGSWLINEFGNKKIAHIISFRSNENIK